MNSSPLFINSIVSTDIDFIQSDDPDAFLSLSFVGRDRKEMPGSLDSEELIDEEAFIFEATFSNNKKLPIWLHSSFGTEEAAQEYAEKATGPLGKLPQFMRDRLDHVVIHKGDHTAFGEHIGHFFVLYSDNMDTRISNNDLEETVFHESVHASLDLDYAEGEEWISAQVQDCQFITHYAKDNFDGEDLAETAIFAYTMITNPGRLDSSTEDWIKLEIPNRLAFFRALFE